MEEKKAESGRFKNILDFVWRNFKSDEGIV
jgi:hypothetical protein